MSHDQPSLSQILSPGTKVVTLVEARGADGTPVHARGSVAEIVQSPSDYWHAYRVRFPGGAIASLKRGELTVLRQYQDGVVAPSDAQDRVADRDLYQHVILSLIHI